MRPETDAVDADDEREKIMSRRRRGWMSFIILFDSEVSWPFSLLGFVTHGVPSTS